MRRFLQDCAAMLAGQQRKDFEGLCLVFPNRRAALFFRAYLKELLRKPVLAPAVTTMNEWVMSFSGLVPADPLFLAGVLYRVYLEETGRRESFDDFYFWAGVMLADFDDADKYLADAGALFSNLSQLKDPAGSFDYLSDEQKKLIGQFWGSLSAWQELPLEKDFVTIWEKLHGIYTLTRHRLSERGAGYPGMIMRDGLERLLEGKVVPPFQEYWFIGMNALNQCEKKMLAWFRDRGKASFFWDYDRYYLDNPKHDAGRFMRENLQLFPPPADFRTDSARFSHPKAIELVAASSLCGQAQVIPSLITADLCGGEGHFDSLAIVLADESLLFPVLGAIPAFAGPVNVTMGYPVKNSPVVSLLLALIALFRNAKTGSGGKPRLFARQVIEILNHPLLAGVANDLARRKISEIRKGNKVYLSPDELAFTETHRLIFSMPAAKEGYSAYFLRLLERLYELSAGGEEQKLLQELVSCLYREVEKIDRVIRELQREGLGEVSLPVFLKVLLQFLGQMAVPFEGEPLSGLQVMGILETRCLDFDRVVIIGLNEDKWPRASSLPSLIPYHLRKGFGLPGNDDRDAMYSYYFYRLLQHPRQVTAAWSTAGEAMSGGELSRFGFQLLHLSPHRVVRRSLDYRLTGSLNPPLEAAPGVKGIARLLELNRTGAPLSPSALIAYLTCPLKFWLRYGAGVKEPDDLAESVDRLIFGNIFHRAVEILYQPLVGHTAGAGWFEETKKDRQGIRQAILRAFASAYFCLPESGWENLAIEGQSLLIYKAVESYIAGLLEADRKRAPFRIVGLENKMEITRDIEVDGITRSLRLGGIIDRLDEKEGILRVVDYKTGSLKSGDLHFSSLEELFDDSMEQVRKEVIQALFYSFLVTRRALPGGVTRVEPSVYAVLALRSADLDFSVRMAGRPVDMKETAADFGRQLDALLSRIYGEEGRFGQTTRTGRCKICPYQPVCRL